MRQGLQSTTQSKLKSIVPNTQAREETLLSRLPKPITTIRKEGNQLLSQLLDTCFSDIDDTLFDLAKNALKQEDQDDYFFAMREVRAQKKAIIENFSSGVNSAFCKLSIPNDSSGTVSQLSSISVDDLAVVGNDDLDEIVALEAIASRATACYEHPLNLLTARVNSIAPADTEAKDLPVSPTSLCNLFAASVKTVTISTKSTLVLFKLYEKTVLNNLGQLYHLMNTILIERGILPEVPQNKQSITAPSESVPSHDGSGGLHLPVEGFDIPFTATTSPTDGLSTPPVNHPAGSIFDVLTEQRTSSPTTANTPQNYLTELLETLNTDLNESGHSNINITAKERNLVTILDRLFSTVDKNTHMTRPVKSLFQNLQLPLAKIALTDQTFFSNPKHSARQLLNTLSSAAIKFGGLNPQRLSQDPLYQHIERTVKQLVNTKTPSSEDFSQHLAAFDKYSEQEANKEALLEKQLIRAEEGRLKALKVEKMVTSTIEEVCQGMEIKAAVNRIIQNAWKNVMSYTALKYGNESEQWDDALQTLIELVTGTQAYVNQTDLNQAKNTLIELKTKITEGLLHISYDAFKTTKLITSLETTFNELSKPNAPTENAQTHDLPMPQTTDSIKERILHQNPPVNDNQEIEPEAEKPIVSPEKPMISPAFLMQAKMLSRGTWFDFKADADKTRCRLAAIIAPHQQFIFVTNLGVKVTSNTLDEVALMLQEQTLVYLDSNHIFDTALEQVISGLKRAPKTA